MPLFYLLRKTNRTNRILRLIKFNKIAGFKINFYKPNSTSLGWWPATRMTNGNGIKGNGGQVGARPTTGPVCTKDAVPPTDTN